VAVKVQGLNHLDLRGVQGFWRHRGLSAEAVSLASRLFHLSAAAACLLLPLLHAFCCCHCLSPLPSCQWGLHRPEAGVLDQHPGAAAF